MVIKKFIFSLLLLLLSEAAFCQVVAIQCLKENTLYIGVANPVVVAVEGSKSNSIELSAKGVDIREDDFSRKGHYNLRVDKPGAVCVYVKKEI